MKKIKTDNPMTLAVMGAMEQYKELRQTLDAFSKVPFMHREQSKYDRAKQRQEYDNRF